jgi:hypothetical protein
LEVNFDKKNQKEDKEASLELIHSKFLKEKTHLNKNLPNL